MFPISSDIQTADMVVLFEKITNNFGGIALLEEVCHWEYGVFESLLLQSKSIVLLCFLNVGISVISQLLAAVLSSLCKWRFFFCVPAIALK